MPTEVLAQLRALRENIAESLRKDPRFLTLAALDKSIAEISGVLAASGLLPADPAPPPSTLHFDPPAPPQPTPSSSPAPAASQSPPQVAPPASADGAAPETNGPVEKKNNESILRPAIGAAAALTAVGVAAGIVHAAQDKSENNTSAADDLRALGRRSNGAIASAEFAGAGVILERKSSGYVPMQAKEGAAQYQPAISVKFGRLPNKVDLRPLMTPIEDQGETSSCVANAVAGAYEYWIKKATKKDQNISRLFVYYNARWRDSSQDKDDGSVIQLAMDGLAKFGACNEKVWPFDKRLVIKKPGADAYEDALPWRVQDMQQVPLTLESWKQALAEGKPIVFGIALFDTFDKCAERGGVVEMPSPDDLARSSHGGHAMCAVGYSDAEKVFIVRNSWGPDWADKGYCYMPFAYLLNPKFNDGDSWVFVPKVPIQPPREMWFDDTKPVTNDGKGVDFVIEPYTVDDYKHVAFDFFDRVRRPFNTFVSEDFAQYVSFANNGLWSSMESFDYRTFLASAAALTGVAVTTSAIASEFSSGTSTSSEHLLSETDIASDEDQDADEAADAEEASDEDQDEDDESDKEETDDDDNAGDEESDENQDDDEESDEDEGEDSDKDEDDGGDRNH